MKIAITGHCGGIGAGIYQKLVDNNVEVIGFDIKNGYDVGETSTIENIISLSADCDIFINNAYHSTGQRLLLDTLIQSWQNKNKLIINIGSSLLYEKQLVDVGDDVRVQYQNEKVSQQQIIKNFNTRTFENKHPLKITQVNPGHTETELLKTMTHHDEIFAKIKLLNAVEVANIVYSIIDFYNHNIYIKEITFEKL
jgi:NADP-dependent 3-hydroxy acid dehydrogenase YdfG